MGMVPAHSPMMRIYRDLTDPSRGCIVANDCTRFAGLPLRLDVNLLVIWLTVMPKNFG